MCEFPTQLRRAFLAQGRVLPAGALARSTPGRVAAVAGSLLLAGLLLAQAGCVAADGDAMRGLSRRPGGVDVLIPDSAPAAKLGLRPIGEVELPLMGIRRVSRAGAVLAVQIGPGVVLVDTSARPLRTSRGITGASGAIDLMYGSSIGGFPVVVEAIDPAVPVATAASGAAPVVPQLPQAARLSVDGRITPVTTGLPPSVGVQCWTPIGTDGQTLIAAASEPGQQPVLWLCRAGKAERILARSDAASSGYFMLIPSGDAGFVAALRLVAGRVVADVIDLAGATLLYSVELGSLRARTVTGGWGGAVSMRDGISHNELDDSPGALWRLGPLQWGDGAAARGLAMVPLRSCDDARYRLHGRRAGSVLRLPPQVEVLARGDDASVIASGTQGAWVLDVAGVPEQERAEPSDAQTFMAGGGARSESGDAGLRLTRVRPLGAGTSLGVGASERRGDLGMVLRRVTPGVVMVLELGVPPAGGDPAITNGAAGG